MWLLVGGRQVDAIAKAIKEYNDEEIIKVDMIDNFVDMIDNFDIEKMGLEDVKCVVVLDAGLHSVRNWEPVKKLGKRFSNVDVLLYSRFPKLTPKKDTLGKNVCVRIGDNNRISISEIAKRLREYE